MKITMSSLLSRLCRLFKSEQPDVRRPGHPATIWRIAPIAKQPSNQPTSGIDDDTDFVRIYPSRRPR